MKLGPLALVCTALFATPALASAQQAAVGGVAAPVAATHASPHADPFVARLDAMLRESRERKRRMVLWVRGAEVAGVVLEHGPGWVLLTNQPGQEILLRTHDVERAEFR